MMYSSLRFRQVTVYYRSYSRKVSEAMLRVHQGRNKLWVMENSSFKNSKGLVSNLKHDRVFQTLQSLPTSAISALLPHDYPHSVGVGYRNYVVGQITGSIASSAAGVLSMQALLHAVGLGSGAIPMAAALNWVIKDGLGQLGGVIFAATVNTKFDSDPRKWRLLSSLALDGSCFLELMTPAAPAFFIPLAAVANVGKNVSWLSASASRAAIHNSFAHTSNLGDITAKTGTQSICASLIGTSLGIGISSAVGSEWGIPLVASFMSLSASHIAATVWSLRSVTLNTVNAQRASMIVNRCLEGGCVPTPQQIAEQEPLLKFHPTADWLLYGVPLNCAVKNVKELEDCLAHDTRYLLSVRRREGSHPQHAIMLICLEHSTSSDLVQALVHANLVKKELESTGLVKTSLGVNRSLQTQDWLMCPEAVEIHKNKAKAKAIAIVEEMSQVGWDVGVCHFDSHVIRLEH